MTITVISSNFFILILILMLRYILVIIHVAVIVAIIGSVISTCVIMFHHSRYCMLMVLTVGTAIVTLKAALILESLGRSLGQERYRCDTSCRATNLERCTL